MMSVGVKDTILPGDMKELLGKLGGGVRPLHYFTSLLPPYLQLQIERSNHDVISLNSAGKMSFNSR